MKRRTLNSLLAFFSLGFGFAPSIVEAAVTSCDVLVVGSGAAGLSAALEAADAGCKVILLEKRSLRRRRYSAFRRVLQCSRSKNPRAHSCDR